MNVRSEIEKALRYYNAGDYGKARDACLSILKKDPHNPEVQYFLGVVYSHLGDHRRAIDHIKKSLARHPQNPDGYHIVAMSYQSLGRLEEAEEYYRKTIESDRNYAVAYNNLANVLKERGRIGEAMTYYRKACELQPETAMFHYNLGVAYQEKKEFGQAVQSYRNALKFDPKDKKILTMLAGALKEKGKGGSKEELQEAERIFREMVSSDTSDVVSLTNLGKVLQDLGNTPEALTCFQKALDLNPDFDEAHFAIADLYQHTDKFEEALIHYRRAIAINPRFIEAYNNLGVLLSDYARFDEALDCFENVLRLESHTARSAWVLNNIGNILSQWGKSEEAEQRYRKSLSIDPSLSKVQSNLLLAMHYNPRHGAEELFQEHLAYSRQMAEPLYPVTFSFHNDRSESRRLRIGYLSPDFRAHSVAYFIEPVLWSHHKGGFEIFCYSDIEAPDLITGRIRCLADHWREIARLTDAQIADLIRNDGIDILVDLTGHTERNRLLVFARKPAPIQVTWIGYPSTTGLKTMDYKVVDRHTDPPGMTEQYYTERLVRMPDCFLCYLPERLAPQIEDPPVNRNGYVTFGSFNNLAKVSDEILRTWAEILTSVPGSRLILKAKGLSSKTACSRVLEALRKNGVSDDRIELHAAMPTTAQHLGLYNRIDIALDTFPYHGTTTTCEALWMGVPVVTHAGATHASRVGVTLLTNVGLTELIARDSQEYKEIAKALANNPERLRSLRKALRGMVAASPLVDAKRFTPQLEREFRQMWIDWCRQDAKAVHMAPSVRAAKDERAETGITTFPLPIAGLAVYREILGPIERVPFVVCVMFTPGDRYQRYANRLADSCERFELPYRIVTVPSVHTSLNLRGTGDPACTKANFIAFMMDQFPGKNILYLDVDVLFMEYPQRIVEISRAGYDLALYNWLADRHNEAYMPVTALQGGGGEPDGRYFFSHQIPYFCTDQMICSGGVQFYRNAPETRRLLRSWQEVISLSPESADDECLDYAFNNIDPENMTLRTAWLDKSYLRMPWWPHVKPVILHPGIPRAGSRSPLPDFENKKRFYPEWCEEKKELLLFPVDCVLDVKKRELLKVEHSRVVETRPVQQEFWIYPEEM